MMGNNQNDSKKLWKTIKNISGDNKNSGINKLIVKGVQLDTPQLIATGLNNYFSDKILDIKSKMPEPAINLLEALKATEAPNIEAQESMELTDKELSLFMKDVKRNCANGSDSINGQVLQDIFPSIRRTILHMINLSLCTGIFPTIFKTTKIAPILKPGKDPLTPESYRPVSNICALGKLIERAQIEQIRKHLNLNSLINTNQHGGLKQHSTTTCLLEIVNKLNEAQELKQKSAVLAIDLSSAYDLVDHNLLLQKCRLLKLGKLTLKWIQDYLANRQQYVEVNGEQSTKTPLGENSVIQGAPSSGDFFLIFLNNLPDMDKAIEETDNPSTKQFVDDINSVIVAKTNEELKIKILKEYLRLENILITHKMKINRSKTQLMYVKPDEDLRKHELMIDDTAIIHQRTMKILGLTLCEDLKYEEHLYKSKTNMVKSINAKCAVLRLIKPYISSKNLAMVGSSLVNSTILYAAPVWGTTSLTNIMKIQSCQIKAARIITGNKKRGKKREHRQTILDQLNWPNTTQIIHASSMNIVKRAITLTSSKDINSMFIIKEPLNQRQGKGQTLNHKGPVNRSETHFSAKGVKLYNNLPHNFRHKLISCTKFKNHIKKYSRAINLLQMH